MVVNDNALNQMPSGALTFFASDRASTGCSYRFVGPVIEPIDNPLNSSDWTPADGNEIVIGTNLVSCALASILTSPFIHQQVPSWTSNNSSS